MIGEQYRLIIFDWDGTLMDSAAKIVACFQAAARDLELPEPGSDLVERQIGLSLELAWKNILEVTGETADAKQLASAVSRYRDYFLEIDQTPMPFYEGVEEGIRSLDESGFLLAIATGKARVGLQRSLRETDLERHFVYSRCGDEAFSKPHPQMLLDTLEFCGCEPGQALMIGDTVYDLQMAANAGVDSLAVGYGVQESERLVPMATLGCAGSFNEVVNIVRQFDR